MLKIILTSLAAALIVFTIIVYKQPDEFRVTRSLQMAASADKIFPHVNNLEKWQAWSPWAKLDPNAKTTFEGPKEGTGAIMRWDGNREVGAGSMTITESRPSEAIQFKLDFLKPMESTSNAEFTFKPEGNQTTVSWTMYGKNNFIGKAIGLIFDCEKMVGEQFEKGLSNIKTVVEAEKK